MIFATIKVVKSWDFQQYISMEREQRIAIRRALNEDSDKLIQVCDLTSILALDQFVLFVSLGWNVNRKESQMIPS